MDTFTKAAIVRVVVEVYNTGLMRYDSFSICGYTITMNMYPAHNRLTIAKYGKSLNIAVYDTDSTELQEKTIEGLVNQFIG